MKRKHILILFVISVISALFCCACSNGQRNSIDDYDYDWSYVKEFVDEADDFMHVDGVLDEEVWGAVHYFDHVENDIGVSLHYSTVFTGKGLYIAAIAEDSHMQWNARFNFSHFRGRGALNSAFWFQVSGPDVVDGHAARLFNFFVDPYNRASRNQTRFDAAVTTNGDVKAGTATKMTAELFVTWDALNIELGEDGSVPEFVYLVPSYRYVQENSASCVDNRWIWPTSTYPENMIYWHEDGYNRTLSDFNYYRAKTGVHFNQDGYINYDREGALVGNADSGVSKSDGWDLSNMSKTGEVSVVGPYEQLLFIKGVYSEQYYFKTTLKVRKDEEGHEWPSIGLGTCITKNKAQYMYLNGGSIVGGDIQGWYYERTNSTTLYSYNLNTYNTRKLDSIHSDDKDLYNEGIDLELIKNGPYIYYIAEGQYCGYDYIEELAGKTCPALFSIGGRGTYSNISYELDPNKVKEEMEKYCLQINVVTQGSGKVECEKSAIKKVEGAAQEDAVIHIEASNNYIVSNVELGGVDKGNMTDWEFIKQNYKDGALTIAKEKLIDDYVDINVKFDRLRASYGEQVVDITGNVSTNKNELLAGYSIRVYATNNELVFYNCVTSNVGKYNISVLRAGEYVFSGNTIYLDGKYTICAVGDNGLATKYFEVDLKDIQEPSYKLNLTLEELEFQPTTMASNRYNGSQVAFTEQNTVNLRGAYYFTDKSVAQDQAFTLYTTVKPIGGDMPSECGFAVGTGDNSNGHYIFFALKHDHNGYSLYFWTEGGTGVGYNATPINFSGNTASFATNPLNANGEVTLKLIYRNGTYKFYLNNVECASINENDTFKEGRSTFKNAVGTEGNIKLGLLSLNKVIEFADFGFTKD